MKKVTVITILVLIVAGLILTVTLIPRSRQNQKGSTGKNVLASVEQALEKGELLEARDLCKAAMEQVEDTNALAAIQKKLEEINIKIIFSPLIDECSAKYTVKPQDNLSKIAKQFNTNINLIQRSNDLASDAIRSGQVLKVNTCKFSIAVDKSQNLLFLKRNGEIMKTYIVSTGKNNSTPVGDFKVVNKLVDPTWYKTGAVIKPDSPENILGTRWLGFDAKGYGIHGTTEPEKLGTQVTLGCVRMNNADVEELFDIVPVGTDVQIID